MFHSLQMAIKILSTILIISEVVSPEKTVDLLDETRAMIYLMRYGYVDPNKWSNSLVTEDQYRSYVSHAVMEFQAFAGLDQTGIMDTETREMMLKPRCGVRDIVGHGAKVRRKKRYALQGSKWPQSKLTYTITRYPSNNGLTRREVTETAEKAFKLWADASGLDFVNAGDNNLDSDIEISFVSYEHGDGDPLDGPGGTLAHAYFPQFGGDVHMDDSEKWTIDSFSGTNMLQTLTHEIGHSLGLSHSDIRNSIMAPFYRGYNPDMSLETDDIRAIQALYGPDIPKPTPPPDTNTVDTNELCSSANIDAIFKTDDNATYVFKEDKFWKLSKEAIEPGYPKKITSDWGGILLGSIDAAFTWERKGATYIFKGNKYWKYFNKKPFDGYPKSISEGFPGIPSNIDAVFVWGGNDKIYFVKKDKYWKFDPDRRPHVRQSQYPKPLSLWGNIPSNIDAAFKWDNGRTYFFKSGQYWRYDDRTFNIAQARPSFPRSSGEWWFGC